MHVRSLCVHFPEVLRFFITHGTMTNNTTVVFEEDDFNLNLRELHALNILQRSSFLQTPRWSNKARAFSSCWHETKLCSGGSHPSIPTTVRCSRQGASPARGGSLRPLVNIGQARALLPLQQLLLCSKTKPNLFHTQWGGWVWYWCSKVTTAEKVKSQGTNAAQVKSSCCMDTVTQCCLIIEEKRWN